ncbi:hypothetical protein [Paraburkholderia phenoliruptrix]|uniref:hypothetical protein n=1 Tax=Paraburkholderia phenoliruptrix TaxID=252970 RepID=UPI002869E817|nr:hypothetical protein [Paraburkholderia phenoliruptrix]WMY08109.1 hypothetical protein P3F88_17850 [Paraburkholderia phenoliruptrix]
MKISRQINHLEKVRYHVRLFHNEDNGDSWRLVDGPNEHPMLTYKEVIAHRKAELIDPSNPKDSGDIQIFRNHVSTLHSYLAYVGKTEDAAVGREMLGSFDKELPSYLDSLMLAARTKSDRRSHLRAWWRTIDVLRKGPPDGQTTRAHTDRTSPFHQLLRLSISSANAPAKSIARRAGASTSALRRWLKGAFPNRRAFASVHRIETALGLERDALLSLVPSSCNASAPMRQRASTEFNERHRHNIQCRYRLSENEMTPEFLHEWHSFFRYKTSKAPQFKRPRRASWRLRMVDKLAKKLPAYAYQGNKGCPSASIEMERVRSFLGYLALPREAGGFGIPAAAAQSLAWLAVPDAVDGYLQFMSERSDGKIHGGHAGFCALGSSVTRAVYGYLTQQPSFASRIPSGHLHDSWANMCEAAYQLYQEWAQGAREISRKPDAPIQTLLNMSEPLAPIFHAIDALDQLAAEAAPGSLQESLYKRDALLLSMVTANPLRAGNFILLSYREDGTGSLYRREDGQWRIRFGANDFKSITNASPTDYDAPLPRALTERIDEYLDEYRPRILKDKPKVDVVFPSKDGTKWENMGKQVARQTRRLIAGSPGFRLHAIRHLVATDWLRKHPGDFLTAAELLHDELQTVLDRYAHLRQDDAFGRFEAHLQAAHEASR